MGEILGALIAVGALYVIVTEFWRRDIDLLYDPSNVRGWRDTLNGNGRLREFRGPLYWTRWLINQW